MRISGWRTALVVAILGAAAPGSQASETTPPPEEGFRAELLTDLSRLEQKLLGLAEAIPGEHYDWRPAANVRTVGEVFRHASVSTFRILQALEIEPAVDLESLESVTEKEELIEGLRSSVELLRHTVLATTDSELQTSASFFGRTWTRRALFYLAATHMHEHLGQSIAYARSLEIAPPWSEELSAEPNP